jgi:hypothetical protein
MHGEKAKMLSWCSFSYDVWFVKCSIPAFPHHSVGHNIKCYKNTELKTMNKMIYYYYILLLFPRRLDWKFTYWGFFPGVKQPEREVSHSTLSNVEVKNEVELYLYSPYTPSSLGKGKRNFFLWVPEGNNFDDSRPPPSATWPTRTQALQFTNCRLKYGRRPRTLVTSGDLQRP